MHNVITNVQAAGHVYLVRSKSDASESAHMLLIFDMLGCSDEQNISGLMVHLKANIGDQCYPNTTSLEIKPWTILRKEFHIIHIGNLKESEYLLDPTIVPSYVVQYQTPAIFQQIADITIPIGTRCTLIQLLANNVYNKLVSDNNNQERWTSSFNCETFARSFLIHGLGLKWPDIEIAGDQSV
ncbi:unnamed protein product [Rotaria sp. Silwood1]|nr:unnamed protein product [Rotaria sp. Silwood1]CAF1471585.1 unnamed protein product [Rotaria sp. Silwood1]CAF4908775.1 unnamed protein product [Rotaria sp. Silwood1]